YVLLEKIKEEKEYLLQNEKNKKNEFIEIKFDFNNKCLPGWVDTKLGYLIELVSGQHLGQEEQNDQGEGLPYLTGPADFGEFNPVATRWTNTVKALAKKNDILITVKGAGVGKANILSMEKAAIGRQLMAIRPILLEYEFIYLLIISSYEKFQALSIGSTVPGMGRKDILDFSLGLPPLAEQKRIVEKCDRLLSTCDEIEKRQQQKQESVVRMNESAIAQLLSSQNPEEFRQHWQRICNNFDLLYSIPETIPKLRQAILQLAVQGKLTRQDPNNEPASVLFEKIKFERKRLLGETNFREPKELKPIRDNEILFELPKEWVWTRIGEIFLISSGTTPNRTNHKYFEDGTEYWVKTTDLNNETVLNCEEKITKQAVLDCNLKYYPVGTVCVALYGGAGTIGKSGLLGIETTINQSVCGIYPNKYVNAKYLHLYIKLIRPLWMNFAASLRKAPNINAGVVNNMVFPLAPLAEQKRIVEKCDRLMSLCDTLEAKLKQGRDSSEKLMEVAAKQVLTA
ncbi:restriction endonuclease subunit S, partial [Trichormus variabilis FSR]